MFLDFLQDQKTVRCNIYSYRSKMIKREYKRSMFILTLTSQFVGMSKQIMFVKNFILLLVEV